MSCWRVLFARDARNALTAQAGLPGVSVLLSGDRESDLFLTGGTL